MKTDLQLQHDVVEELKWQPNIREAEIGLSVKDGVVVLSGFVDTYSQKLAAEHAAERVSGVRAIADGLKVKAPGIFARSDAEIAHQAASALAWHVEVPRDTVTVLVENGWVTLDGEVEWQYQRTAAFRVVSTLTGVKGVTNLITLRPQAPAYDVTQRIKDAVRRSAEHVDDLVKVGL